MSTCPSSQNLNVRDFGAVGDGQTDDTAAFRSALAAAAAGKRTVVVPDGTYLTGSLRFPPHTGLVGNATWGYRSGGGSVLRLNDPAATCLLDITGAVGATINGLSLEGAKLGDQVHGIYAGLFAEKKEEDSPRIERCHISKFTGNGIHLAPIWCFSVRSCEIIFNGGDALYIRGWDGFILDNWFSGNGGCGYHAPEANASVTMTGNRIEWNHGGGIRILGGSHYNITGNYIDRSGGPGVAILARDGAPSFCITVTGNVIYRSGKPEWTGDEALASCHARLEGAHGLVFTGNSMCAGQDDSGGAFSPRYGLVLGKLENAVVKDNTLHIGALDELVHDLGDHQATVVRDNPGKLFAPKPGQNLWSSGQI